MRDMWGYRCFVWTPTLQVTRRWLTVPRLKDYRIRVLFHDHFRIYSHTYGQGWMWVQWGHGGRAATETCEMPFQWRLLMALRRRTPPAAKATLPPLPAPYDVFGPGSLLAEHLSATSYEDGSARTPGSMALRNKGACYEVTVYDHDAGLRIAVVGPTVEQALAQVEVLLAVPDAPWVVDDYLTGILQRKGKRKK